MIKYRSISQPTPVSYKCLNVIRVQCLQPEVHPPVTPTLSF